MKTKDRILQMALLLFNERGLSQVTLRTIANEMGISQGNLNYHFKKREDLIEGLYYQLVARFDELFALPAVGDLDFRMVLAINRQTMDLLYAYRFLLLDFVQIMREHAALRQHFQELGALRTQQFQDAVAILVAKGLMRSEDFEGEYKNLHLRLSLFGDFWVSFSEIRDDLPAAERISKYALHFMEMLYPYFTKKGKKAYFALLAEEGRM